jgi:hypothetical protein
MRTLEEALVRRRPFEFGRRPDQQPIEIPPKTPGLPGSPPFAPQPPPLYPP